MKRMTTAVVQAAAIVFGFVGCGDLGPLVSEGDQEGVVWDCTVDADCNDGNACTQDRCATGLGICQHVNISGCCTSAAQCDDGNSCTADACTNNVCTHTPSCGPP